MKVRELIAKLNQMDPEAVVLLPDLENGGGYELTNVYPGLRSKDVSFHSYFERPVPEPGVGSGDVKAVMLYNMEP